MISSNAKTHCFVICAYKENPFLENAIVSILGQTVESDILLSTSTPNEHIKALREKYDLPMVVNPQPRSLGDDWNYGYNHADAALVTMVHQDDFYEPTFLEETLLAINEYDDLSKVQLAFTDYYEIRNGERVYNNNLLNIKRIMNMPFRLKALNGSTFAKRRILAFGDSICCPAVTLAKMNLGDDVFDTTYKNSCDYKTWVKLAGEPGHFAYVPKKLMGHRIYAESATTQNLADEIRKKEDQEILENLWPAPVARAINFAYSQSEKSNQLD